MSLRANLNGSILLLSFEGRLLRRQRRRRRRRTAPLLLWRGEGGAAARRSYAADVAAEAGITTYVLYNL